MMSNMNDLMQLYQRFKTDPMAMLSQRFNIPSEINNPNDIIQHLLNTGQVTQTQVNGVMGMRNNPMIQQLLNNK